MIRRARGTAIGSDFPWVTLAVLALVSVAALADNPGIRTYAEQDGLPSPWVADLTQGPDGRMWFLTDAGVAAYDGAEWETFDLDTGTALRGGFRFSLQVDGTGWALANHGGLYRFDGRAWDRRASIPVDPAESVLSDFTVFVEGRQVVPAVATLNDGVLLFSDGEWVRLDRAHGLTTDLVHALLVVDETLWIATDRGLWSWKRGELTRRFIPPEGISADIRGLARLVPDPDGREPEPRILLMGADWAGRWTPSGFQTLLRDVSAPGLQNHPRISLVSDRRGGFYFGNVGGLFHFDGPSGRWIEVGQDRGLIGGGVLSFHRDREDNLWIATGVGVSKLSSSPFRNLSAVDGLFEDEVTAVAQLPSGTVVLGHNRGLSLYDDGSVRTLALPAGPVPRVLDLETDDRGGLWIAGSGLGLLRMSPAGQVEQVGQNEAAESSLQVASARFDAGGRLWLGGPAGIFRLERRRIVPVSTPVEPLRLVRRIFTDRDGALYFATGGSGLLIMKNGQWTQVLREDDAAANNVFAVLQRGDGRVLVGTHGGLFELKGDAIVDPDGLGVPRIHRPVYSLMEDPQDRLWIGTNFGFYRVEDGGELRHFATGQGLAGLETNRAAAFVDSKESIWLGTDRGVSVVDPRWWHEGFSSPRVELLKIEVGGKALDPGTAPRLVHDRNELTFRIRAMSFIDEREMSFRTRLEGLEDGWTVHRADSTRLDLRYPRLPRGAYRFEAQARNVQGDWGPVTRSSPIEVAAPFWLRGWFFGLVAGALILVALAIQYLVAQRRYATRLERDIRSHTLELDRARQAAESEKERLDTVLANIVDGVIALDADDRVVLSNPAAERILALPPGTSTGRPIHELLADNASPARTPLLTWLRGLRDGPERMGVSPALTVIGGEGEARVLEFAAAPYTPPAAVRPGIVLAFRDISERRRAEEERARARRLEALGVLAGGIAHDFNNILTAILGNISLSRETAALDPSTETRLADAEKAIGRAHRLARQLVTFGKGGAPLTRSISIAELLRQTARFVFSGSGVLYSVRVPEDLWPAEADSDQIRQVFENLFLNARQSMKDSGTVEIAGDNVEESGGTGPGPGASAKYVRIDVRDHGEGIRAEHLDRIFEPYFTTKSEGSGLGLATSYSIVHRHGGRMTVRSTEDGTTFSVYLPASSGRLVSAKNVQRAGEGRARARVLVLEDEPAVGAVLRAMLVKLGHDAVVARDGDEALTVCREETDQGRRFDVAILDLTIRGGRGGAEIVGELCTLGDALPAIASSGYAQGKVMSSFAEFGFAAVLPKPYNLAQVSAAIEGVLRAQAADRPRGVPSRS